MGSKSHATFKMLVFGFIALSALLSGDAPLPIEMIWWAISAYCGARALLMAFKPRRCGHGAVTQSGSFFYPWVIDPCPKCSARTYVEGD